MINKKNQLITWLSVLVGIGFLLILAYFIFYTNTKKLTADRTSSPKFSSGQAVIYSVQEYNKTAQTVVEQYYLKSLHKEDASQPVTLFYLPFGQKPSNITANKIIYFTTADNGLNFYLLDLGSVKQNYDQQKDKLLFSLTPKTNFPITVQGIFYEPEKQLVDLGVVEADPKISGEKKITNTLYEYSLQNNDLTELKEYILDSTLIELVNGFEDQIIINQHPREQMCGNELKLVHRRQGEEISITGNASATTCFSPLVISSNRQFILFQNSVSPDIMHNFIPELVNIYDIKELKFSVTPLTKGVTAENYEDMTAESFYSAPIWNVNSDLLIVMDSRNTEEINKNIFKFSTLAPHNFIETNYSSITVNERIILTEPLWQDQLGGLIAAGLEEAGAQKASAPYKSKLYGLDSEGYFEITSSEPNNPLTFIGVAREY